MEACNSQSSAISDIEYIRQPPDEKYTITLIIYFLVTPEKLHDVTVIKPLSLCFRRAKYP
jgi:hypothetical protein